MKKHSYSRVSLFAGAIVGVVVGAGLTLVLIDGGRSPATEQGKPLYWVAPMDANYRRDKPGKSPMGMDLIPIYEEAAEAGSGGVGTVTISPDVVNNLGVRTGPAVRQALQSKIVTVGYVQYDENLLIHIHPRVSGWVEKLYVKATGNLVEQGEPLYSLYSPELVNAQEELVLALNRDSQGLAEASENRLRALQIPTGFIAKLKRTRKISQTVNFYAPQSGVVDNLNIREGFFVQPGTTMLSIGALDKVWVEAEIFERQASLVNVGDPVTMTLGYLPGRAWRGTVDYVYPTLDSDTRTVRLRVSVDNPERKLKPNMFVQVTVHTDSKDALLVIPREALIRTGSQDRVVLALGGGRFKSIEVNIGRSDHEFVEIKSGLDEGEKVVTSAQFLLDSESSKTSDFRRMHHADSQSDSVWVAAQIQEQRINERSVTVNHEAIDAWDMPQMLMTLPVDASVDIEQLTPGTQVHIQLLKRYDGGLAITGIHIMSAEDANDNHSDAMQIDSVPKSLPEKNASTILDADTDHSMHKHSEKQPQRKQNNQDLNGGNAP